MVCPTRPNHVEQASLSRKYVDLIPAQRITGSSEECADCTQYQSARVPFTLLPVCGGER